MPEREQNHDRCQAWSLRSVACSLGLLFLVQAGLAIGQTDEEIETVFWQSVECKSARQVQAYFEVYPMGRYLAEAWACLEGQLGLDRAERILVQQGLATLEYEVGAADGLFGPATRRALRAWQTGKGFTATGYLTREQADTLIAQGRAAMSKQREREAARRMAQTEAERAAQEGAARQTREEDDAAYDEAQRVDTVAGYAEYLRAYPNGQHAQEARAREAALREERRQAQADEAAYARAEATDTAAAYGDYLATYPQGRYAAEARRRQRQRQYRVGQTFRDELRSGGQGPQMVVVPAGSFQMGAPSYETGRYDDEGPVHHVAIGKPFAVGVHEVTVGEFGKFVAATRRQAGERCRTYQDGEWNWRMGITWRAPGFRQTERDPVVCVSWADAQAYVGWLSGQTGQWYRLLSETEWEYVARAGTTTARWWGEREAEQCRYANGADSSTTLKWRIACSDGYARTAPVGSYEANGFGLYEIVGNVREWVQDCWNESYAGAPIDGRAWESGDCSHRGLRGGSWWSGPRAFRSAFRNNSPSDYRNNSIGFRVARSLPNS